VSVLVANAWVLLFETLPVVETRDTIGVRRDVWQRPDPQQKARQKK
jgi:hypothetical protein